jgi:hypothetical protein
MRYKADITAGALKLLESRFIADLLLRQLEDAGSGGKLQPDEIVHVGRLQLLPEREAEGLQV